MRLIALLSAGLLSLLAATTPADTVRLTSGRDIDCVILDQTAEHYTIRRGYGVMDIPVSMVASAKRAAPISLARTSTRPAAVAVTVGSAGRMPAWSAVVDAIAKQPWGKGLTQIPATYIDNGVMKDVPYQSYAIGDYEVNIYGDPDDPACIEIGVYRSLLNDDACKRGCVELLAGLLPNPVDAAIARALDPKKDLVSRYEFTVEITPPDAPDAYGGWWVSIYDETKLEKSRATAAEIQALTVATPPTVTVKPVPPRGRAAVAAVPAQRPAPPAARAFTGEDSDNDWSPSDLQRRGARASASGSSSPSGGRVYVRGYSRKDGTYVSPHTRSSPRHR